MVGKRDPLKCKIHTGDVRIAQMQRPNYLVIVITDEGIANLIFECERIHFKTLVRYKLFKKIYLHGRILQDLRSHDTPQLTTE